MARQEARRIWGQAHSSHNNPLSRELIRIMRTTLISSEDGARAHLSKLPPFLNLTTLRANPWGTHLDYFRSNLKHLCLLSALGTRLSAYLSPAQVLCTLAGPGFSVPELNHAFISCSHV
jgi:hypothetical protein